MRVALIIKNLKHGGAERAMARLSYILSDAGHEVFLILLSSKSIEYDYTGKLITLDSGIRKSIVGKIGNVIRRSRDLKKAKIIYNIEVAISFLDTPNISNILTKGKEKVLVSVRNYKSSEDRGIYGLINKAMIKHLYPKSDNVIAVSEEIKNDLINNYKLKKDKIRVIYNPYDVDKISLKATQKLNEEYEQFYSNSRVIVTVGRLSRQKGYLNLIKSFVQIKKRYNDIKLVIVGDGEQENQLRQLAKDMDIDKDVLFAGYQENPFSFIKSADLYVMTSLFEGFPNAVVEAMACSIPIISVDCKSGPREILYQKPDLGITASKVELADYGIICPPFDEEENWDSKEITNSQMLFSSAIELLLNDNKLYSMYASKAFERANHFSFEECKKRYNELITGE
jgi:glycosyltransferase involved in cell wall biosynthesis